MQDVEPIPITRRNCSKCLQDFPAFDLERLCPHCRKPKQTARKPAEPGHILTPRELQVAKMVHRDLTDKEIAARLFLSSKGTIKGYIHDMKIKLGVRSRVGIALWVEANCKSTERNVA